MPWGRCLLGRGRGDLRRLAPAIGTSQLSIGVVIGSSPEASVTRAGPTAADPTRAAQCDLLTIQRTGVRFDRSGVPKTASVNGGVVAGGILLLVNKNGNPGTLVSAHPGNTNAARHGAFSPRLIEPQAAAIEEGLFHVFEFTATQRIAVHQVARCMAILDAIDRDLDERGLVDRGGKSRSILNHRARISRQLDHWLAKISPAIDRQTACDDEHQHVGRPDYDRELRRIALGDDSTATTRDRLTAIDRLSELESRRDSVTQVTMNIFRDQDGTTAALDGEPEDAESNENSGSTPVSA